MNLNCEILAVGTELLLGNIVNTNARFISEELAVAGINVLYHSVVGDNEARLCDSFKLALSRADVVILSGGLGPTQDDLTKETIFKTLGLESVFNEACYEKVIAYFKAKGKKCPDSNKKQAFFPKEAIICDNKCGTAPGCILPLENKTVVILPGPPSELEPMFKSSVIPYLTKMSGNTIYSKAINLFGIGESEAEEKIADLIHGSNPSAAFYAKTGRVQIRVTGKADDKEKAKALVMPLVNQICEIFGDKVYGFDDDTLESVAVEALKNLGKKVAVAESCTSGLVAKKLTDIPGASAVFEMGFCTYSDEAKAKLLKVSKKTLKLNSSISGEVARLMAEGAKKRAHADFGLATTGLAGPDTDASGKPVGTVYIAVAYGDHTIAEKLFITRGIHNDREYIREITSMHALSLLINAINKFSGNNTDCKQDLTSLSDNGGFEICSDNNENSEEADATTKTDEFMNILNQRKIEVDENNSAQAVNKTDTEEVKAETEVNADEKADEAEVTQEIKEAVTADSKSESALPDMQSTDEDTSALNASAKRTYNFDLFE